MVTTVQVREETQRLLERLKREMGLTSYDEVISRLVRAKTGLPSSLFGACRGSHPFFREDEEEHGI
ncbi:hypothetical protein KEJ51_07160 [Candidatus Bathyarchaeota archaeon]|nr:hypothetical protein [Candidatus Bathyarchaeota archaeon]